MVAPDSRAPGERRAPREGGALKVKDRGREHAVRTRLERLGQVREVPRAARGDDRNRDGAGSRTQEIEIVARPGAVAVHRGEQDLARAERLEAADPLDRLERRLLPSAVHHHGEPVARPPHVHRRHDALAAEALGEARDERRVAHGGGVHRDLVRARPERGARVRHRPDTAADGERNEDATPPPGATISSVVRRCVGARRDVEEDQLVGTFGVVARGLLHRIAGVAQRLEVHALHDPPARDVEAGNDPPR